MVCWWLGTLAIGVSGSNGQKRRKTTVRMLALAVSAVNLNVPPPDGIGNVDSLKCTLNTQQKSKVAKFVKMLHMK